MADDKAGVQETGDTRVASSQVIDPHGGID
jgi:hypothetical protein